ncbi:MAG: hypothetical protein QME92_08640 [Bacillota bacterium]|nr:hypothetical protein [Bacillota bacterium]
MYCGISRAHADNLDELIRDETRRDETTRDEMRRGGGEAQACHQIVKGEAGAPEVILEDLAVLDKRDGRPHEEFAEPAPPYRNSRGERRENRECQQGDECIAHVELGVVCHRAAAMEPSAIREARLRCDVGHIVWRPAM